MKKSRSWPLVSFLISIIVCALLFIPDWELAVQAKASTVYQYIAGVALPLLGVAVFGWGYRQAKKAKSKRYETLNTLAIVIVVGWLGFTLFALIIGSAIAPAFDKALNT